MERKHIGNKHYLSHNRKIINFPEYRTKGEEFLLVKDVTNCRIILDSTTTSYIVIKSMTNVTIKSIMNKIDEDFDEIVMERGSCAEFLNIDNYWYIISSDGLKLI